MRERRHVVVLGGGACGMSAALELVRMGVRVTLLERESYMGGLCGTCERDGFRFDFGGHRFLTGDPRIDALVRELVGEDLLERTRSSVILNGGKRYRYPLELDDVVRQFGVRRGARAVASYLVARGRRWLAVPRDGTFDGTFEGWVTARFGAVLYRAFFGPYTAKLWGVKPDAISADWAAQRIAAPSLAAVLARLCGVARSKSRRHARRYLYPRLGIGQIFERCNEAIAAAGGRVLTGATVTGLDRRGQRVTSVRYRQGGQDRDVACDALISTLSLPKLVAMSSPVPHAVARAAGRLRFRALRLLNLELEGPPISEHTWMYVSEPEYLPSRIQEPLHRSPDMVPPGFTSLMLEIPCAVGDAVWTAPDAEIYERCMRDLSRLGLPPLRARTLRYFSTFVAEGYPIYHVGYASDRSSALAHVEGLENVVSCGRQGAFRYIFMDTAMTMGIMAAGAIVGRGSRADVVDLHNDPSYREVQALSA